MQHKENRMKKNSIFLLAFIISGSIQLFSQQASLTINNKSDRFLTVKVMKGPERTAKYFKTDSVAPKGTQTIYFSETGLYFTKCQAVLIHKDPKISNDTIYSKDRPFQVISDKKRGYSNITMEFTVKESKKPVLQNVTPITRKEYDGN